MPDQFQSLDDYLSSPEFQGGEPVSSGAPADMDASPTWADYGRALQQGAYGLAASANSFAKYIDELNGRDDMAEAHGAQAKFSRREQAESIDKMTPSAKSRLGAAITDGEFWDHPFSATALKLTGMSPALAASIVPGGLFADTLTAVSAAALAGGAVNTGQALDEFYRKVDDTDDKTLQESSDVYRGLRTMMPEKEARRQYDLELLGWKPTLNFVIGAAAGLVGPAGTVARGSVVGAAEKGLVSRAADAAVEGGVGGAAQAGAANAMNQQALIQGGLQKDFNDEELVKATLEPGLMGGITGAAAGAAFGGRAHPRLPDEAPVRNPVREPATPETSAPKDVVAVPDAGPAPDQEAALRSDAPQPQAPDAVSAGGVDVPAEVAAASQRLRGPQVPPDLPERVAETAAGGPKVEAPPPDVVAASERLPRPEAEPVAEAPAEPVPEAAPEAAPEVAQAAEPAAQVTPEGNQASATPKRTGRVLMAQDDESIRNGIAQQKQQDRNLAALNIEEKQPTGKNRSAADKEARANEARELGALFIEHASEPRQTPVTPKQRDEVVAAAKAIVQAAAEKGLAPKARPGRIKDVDPAHFIWLNEAARLANKKRPSVSDAVKFVMRENDIRDGKVGDVRADRAVEGDIAMRKEQGDVEAPTGKLADMVASESPEEALARKQEEGEESQFANEEEAYAAGRERPRKMTPATEALVEKARKVNELAKKGSTPGERAAAEAAAKRITSAGNPADFVAGKDKAGSFKVETKSRRVPLKPKAASAVEGNKPTHASPLPANAKKMTMLLTRGNGEKGVDRLKVTGAHDFKTTMDAGGEYPQTTARARYSTTVKDFYDSTNVAPRSTIAKAIYAHVRGKLLQGVPDMKVYVVSAEEMRRLYENAAGFYDPTNDHIVLSEAIMNDVGLRTYIMTHEGIHALTSRALHGDKEFTTTVEHIMAEVREQNPALATKYGMTDAHEFLAEALSNLEFQTALQNIVISERLAKQLDIKTWRKATMWDGVVSLIRRALGLHEDDTTALEAAIRMTEIGAYHRRLLPYDAEQFYQRFDVLKHLDRLDQLVKEHGKDTAGLRQAVDADYASSPTHAITLDEARARAGVYTAERAVNAHAGVRKVKDWASSMWMLASRAKAVSHEFGSLAERLVSAKAMMEREKFNVLEKEGGLQIVNDLAKYRREKGEAAFNEMAELGIDASNLNVRLGADANNDHLGKDATAGWQAKAKLPELQKRFNMLPKDGQELLARTAEFYRQMHNEMSLQTIKNILEVAGIPHEPGLAHRIFVDGLTEDDKARFKTNTVINALNNARELKQLEGWYVPFRRYGEHIVSGEHTLAEPKSGVKIAKDTIQFTDPQGGDAAARRAAEQFVSTHDLRHVQTRKVWVDKKDRTKILDAEDDDAIPAYRVRMQTQHTEFHETQAEANAAMERLKAEGLADVHQRTRRDETVRNSSLVSGDLKNLAASLEQQDRFKEMSPEERASVKQALMEASIRVLGSTKVQSSFLQRRNVGGMSHDLVRITADYARSAAGYLARLRFQPQIDAAFKALDKYIADNKYASPDRVKRMDEMRNALASRFREDEVYTPQTPFAKTTRRLLQISRLDKLAGVSFHVINAQEPWTTSLPVIGGRHGFGRTLKAMSDAYKLIGAREAVMAGLKDTARAYDHDFGFTDYIEDFKNRITSSPHAAKMLGGDKAQRLVDAIEYAQRRGLFSDEAIFEVGRYADPAKNALLRGLDRADLMANQVGAAIEKINRTVTLLSAYDLEFKRTHNHEQAMQYAHEVARDTMGDYSTWNQPAAFKHPVGQLALQFKKFAHKTYYLLGKTFRGTLEGDPEAAKQFAGLMVTHMVVAGALGLPLEPFKVAVLAANALGATQYNWTDVEHFVRERAADVLGTKGGEAFSHGLTRLIGIDTSSRQGLDSLLTFGAPRSEKPQDIKAWLWDTLAGAPASFILDQIKTSQALMKGDIAKAAETFVPIKGIADMIKAGEGVVPQLNDSGKVKMRALSPMEMVAQGLGFSPAAKAENYAKQSYGFQATEREKTQRTALVNKWAQAAPQDKPKVWAEVRQWNAQRPQAQQLTMRDLTSAARRHKTEAKDYDGVLRITKRNKAIADQLGVYNVE